MAERLPVGPARNIKSPSFTSFGSNLSSSDVSNVSVDRLNGQIAYHEPDSNGSNSQLILNGSSAVNNRGSGHNKPGHSEATRNGSRNKDGDSRSDSEWVEQDEPGVYITLTSLSGGVKDLKRVRFSRKRFNEKQAEQWWAENRARVYEQYNVRMVDKSSLKDMAERLPVGPARNIKSPSFTSFGSNLSSSDVSNVSVDRLNGQIAYHEPDSNGSNSQFILNGSSAVNNRGSGHNKPGHSEATRNGSRNKDGDSRSDSEWVEQNGPGVYITLTSLPGGVKDLKGVRFSRKRFSEKQAEQWWAENRSRVYEQYNVRMVDKSSVGVGSEDLAH